MALYTGRAIRTQPLRRDPSELLETTHRFQREADEFFAPGDDLKGGEMMWEAAERLVDSMVKISESLGSH